MIKEIREYYGIPQSMLADYLGIKRSLLSMAEIGKRTLSTEHTQRLLRLYQAIQPGKARATHARPAPMTEDEKARQHNSIRINIQEQEFRLKSLQKSLHKLEQNRLKAAAILASVDILQETTQPSDRGLLDIIKLDAGKLYNQSGEEARLKLEARKEAITARLVLLQQQLKG